MATATPDGVMVGGDRAYSVNGTQVIVSRVHNVRIGGVTYSTSGDAAVSVSSLLGGGSFAADTWYYVYARQVAGILGFEIQTLAPDSSLVWSGPTTIDATRRYVCSFRTDHAGAIVSFSKSGREYRYLLSKAPNAFYFQHALGAPGTPTAFQLKDSFNAASLVPAHARAALCRFGLSITSGGTNAGGVQIQSASGDASAMEIDQTVTSGAGGVFTTAMTTLAIDPTGGPTWYLTAVGQTNGVTGECVGFTE